MNLHKHVKPFMFVYNWTSEDSNSEGLKVEQLTNLLSNTYVQYFPAGEIEVTSPTPR